MQCSKASTAILIEVNNATYVNLEIRECFFTQWQSGVKIKKFINGFKGVEICKTSYKYFNQTTLVHQQSR